MKEPYIELEKRYLIEQRVREIIVKYGSIENAIIHCKKELFEYEDHWNHYSYDCVGHGITCNQLLIKRLEELKPKNDDKI
ncbi:hypothetical protein M0Q50_10525 [bacterium]|jgi:hypothetical protein|nr:hypothetical protein [bacterium]